MFVVYVIVSLHADLFYIGQTGNLLQRYAAHQGGDNRSTRRLRPHVVGHVEVCATRSEAMRREKQLKSALGRAWIRNTIIPEVRLWYGTSMVESASRRINH